MSDRLQQQLKQQQQQNETAFLNALATFKNSANDLLTAWLRADHTGDYFSSDYPFKESFETVVQNISQWLETQENTGFNGESKPESKFHNSILEAESKTFPKQIEVTTGTSNNPHGRYELAVVGKGEVLGVYYYDHLDQCEADGFELEKYFEVTFD